MAKKYRIAPGVGPVSIRKSSDPASPLYQQWHTWEDGQVFTPPAHMVKIGGVTLAEAVKRGALEEVKDG